MNRKMWLIKFQDNTYDPDSKYNKMICGSPKTVSQYIMDEMRSNVCQHMCKRSRNDIQRLFDSYSAEILDYYG